jgi:Zn-dependent membrane protease YugP
MFFDPIYWIVIGVGMALSLWAQFRVKGTFGKYSKLSTRSRMTGAQVAQGILEQNGIRDVKVEPVRGSLSDHYDPRSKTLRLSEPVYGSNSMAAFGVAAHEVGHAIQHAQGYAPLGFRSAWVPVANLGGSLSFIVLIAAAFLGGASTALGSTAALIGVLLFATTTVFTLITLPVEFDASKRALVALESGGFVSGEELNGARKVLNAAAMTYVAAFITSLLTLLYWAYRLGLFGGRRN